MFQPSQEGLAEWIPLGKIGELPVVEDLPVLLSKIHAMKRGDPPFSARSFYDDDGKLIVEFGMTKPPRRRVTDVQDPLAHCLGGFSLLVENVPLSSCPL
jgi:hypothetical protein